MTSPHRGRSLAALLLVPLVLTAGCASGPAAPAASAARPSASLTPMDPPPIGDVPRLTEAGDRALPIEAYLLSGEQFRQYDAAQAVLVARCVRGFGLEYSRPPGSGAAPSQSQTTHRYDPVELADVSAHGYHAPDPGGARKPSGGASMGAELTTVLGTGLGPGGKPAPGSATEFRGKGLPPGGCVGAAQKELTSRGGTGRDADVVVGINYEGFERSMTDPRVRTVFQDWSRCMGDRGYSYATPGDALKDSRWAAAATPSAEEIATATADVDCKARTNVVGVWFTVETAYEDELIRQHQAELTAVKAGNDAMLELARSVAAAGS